MISGVIINRKNIVGGLLQTISKDGIVSVRKDKPIKLLLSNMEVLDNYLTLEYRNLDFSDNLISFIPNEWVLDNNMLCKWNQCGYIVLEKQDDLHVINNIIYNDKDILEELLK